MIDEINKNDTLSGAMWMEGANLAQRRLTRTGPRVTKQTRLTQRIKEEMEKAKQILDKWNQRRKAVEQQRSRELLKERASSAQASLIDHEADNA